MMENTFMVQNGANDNASFVSTNGQMIPQPEEAHSQAYNEKVTMDLTTTAALSISRIDSACFTGITGSGGGGHVRHTNPPYPPHILTTPIVKSHNSFSPIAYPPPSSRIDTNSSLQPSQQQHLYSTIETSPSNIMYQFSSMEIDDYFNSAAVGQMLHDTGTTAAMSTVCSPSTMAAFSASSTNNSSNIMTADNMSPISPMYNFLNSGVATTAGTVYQTGGGLSFDSDFHYLDETQVAFVPSQYNHAISNNEAIVGYSVTPMNTNTIASNNIGTATTNSSIPVPPFLNNEQQQQQQQQLQSFEITMPECIAPSQPQPYQQRLQRAASSERKSRRRSSSAPHRRHTVSTPYAQAPLPPTASHTEEASSKFRDSTTHHAPKQQNTTATTKTTATTITTDQQPTRKSSLKKARRHRSLNRLNSPSTSTAASSSCSQRRSSSPPPPMPSLDPIALQLKTWTHEQLLERVMQLEKEKEIVVQQQQQQQQQQAYATATTSSATLSRTSTTTLSRKQSANSTSHTTDTELEEEKMNGDVTLAAGYQEAEDDDLKTVRLCQWDGCQLEICGLERLVEHVKEKHIGSGKTIYYCAWKDCVRRDRPFSKRHKMYNHLRIHTGERPFICQEADCGKRFSRPDSLMTHSRIHSSERPYICSTEGCEKAYYHLRSLRKHEKAHQQPELGASDRSSVVDVATTMSDHEPSPPPPVPPLPPPEELQQHHQSRTTATTFPDTNYETGFNAASNTFLYASLNDSHDNNDDTALTDWGLLTQAAVFDVFNKERQPQYPFI